MRELSFNQFSYVSASAMANKMAREINSHFMLGTMCALSGIYPATCHPDDVFWSI